jgi:O-antigen/teichoic acid export membrane protein
MLKRVLRNFGVVIRGRGIAGVFSVLATGMMANALSATEFGLVILLHTYIMVVRGALNFRTFEAVVRFGIPLHESGNEEGFRALLRSTMMIDLTSALVAALVGIAAAPLAGRFLHWDPQMVTWASLYSLFILSTANGTPNGILRVYDRFDALGVQFTVAPALRFVMVAVAWALDAPMVVFLVMWGSAFAIGHLYMLVRGLLELRLHVTRSLWSGFHPGELKKPVKDFWNFVGVVYWQTNIDLLPKHVSVLLAGSLLGPAAAGLFRLAREFSTVLTQPAVTLREVLFPDLTRSFHAEDGGIHSVPFKTAVIAGVAGLAIVFFAMAFGATILGVVGKEYIPAAPLLSMLLLAATFDLSAASFRAAAYAMGKAGTVLRIHILSIISYVALFFILTPLTGLTGPGWAAILASLLALFLTARLVMKLSPTES